MRGAALLVVLWAGFSGCPRPNDLYCRDQEWHFDRTFNPLPADGATDVPLNAATFVWGDGLELSLSGPDGAVALTYGGILVGEEWGGVIPFVPDELLQPDTTYELSNYYGVLSTFTTGEEVLSVPPAPPEVLGVEAETIRDPWNPDCDYEVSHLTVTVEQSTPLVLLTPRVVDDPFNATFRRHRGVDFTQQDTLESYVELDSAYVVSVDLAGNLSDWVDLGPIEYSPLATADGCSSLGTRDYYPLAMSGGSEPPPLGAGCLLALVWVRRRRRAARPVDRTRS